MTIYRHRRPTLFASRKDGVKEATYDTTIPTDVIHQDPKYCRLFMGTPEMRDCLSRIISPTIPFHLLYFLSSLSSASPDELGATQLLLLDLHSHICQLSVSQSSLSLPYTHFPSNFPSISASPPDSRFFRFPSFSQDAFPSFMSSSGESFSNVGLCQGLSNRSAIFISPVVSTWHFTPSLPSKCDSSAIPPSSRIFQR